MRKIIQVFMVLLMAGNVFAADEWLKTRPASTDQKIDWPTASQANNTALDRLLANYREGMQITYSSATAVTVGTGSITCSDSTGATKKLRQNTSTTSVGWADIDAGAEASSTTYYIYANCDADAETATFDVSLSSTAPTGTTYYKRLGSFYNNADGNISAISNDTNYFAGIGTATSKTDSVAYLATTDGFFCGVIVAGATPSAGSLIAYSDTTSSPATVVGGANVWVATATAANSANTNYDGFCVPVKKGNYYKGVLSYYVSGSSAPTATYNFYPTGS
jgi:hypothetical protein